MASVRQQILQKFPSQTRIHEPDVELANGLSYMLWSIDDAQVTVDGWTLFKVVQEADDSLDAVGLMTLFPSGSTPIAVCVRATESGLAWSARLSLRDEAWLSLSESKRWKNVYLYASGDREEPPWIWDRRYHGIV